MTTGGRSHERLLGVVEDRLADHVIGGVDDLDVLAKLGGEHLDRFVRQRLCQRRHLAEAHQLANHLGHRDAEILGDTLDRRARVDPDQVGRAARGLIDRRHGVVVGAAPAPAASRRAPHRLAGGASGLAARGLGVDHDAPAPARADRARALLAGARVAGRARAVGLGGAGSLTRRALRWLTPVGVAERRSRRDGGGRNRARRGGGRAARLRGARTGWGCRRFLSRRRRRARRGRGCDRRCAGARGWGWRARGCWRGCCGGGGRCGRAGALRGARARRRGRRRARLFGRGPGGAVAGGRGLRGHSPAAWRRRGARSCGAVGRQRAQRELLVHTRGGSLGVDSGGVQLGQQLLGAEPLVLGDLVNAFLCHQPTDSTVCASIGNGRRNARCRPPRRRARRRQSGEQT